MIIFSFFSDFFFVLIILSFSTYFCTNFCKLFAFLIFENYQVIRSISGISYRAKPTNIRLQLGNDNNISSEVVAERFKIEFSMFHEHCLAEFEANLVF